jgi:hypothetical protein
MQIQVFKDNFELSSTIDNADRTGYVPNNGQGADKQQQRNLFQSN